jgi:hypothetical protein
MSTIRFALALAACFAGTPSAAQHPTMPPGMSHEEHLRQMKKDAELKERGALAMGFDQDKAVHHFLLQQSGGSIVVTSKDAGDATTVAQVRAHFREIADAFRSGAFDKPLATHGELPPGAAAMAANRTRIAYRYDERPGGAAIVIATTDTATLRAIHDFLRYQIVEHKTGDPLQPR